MLVLTAAIISMSLLWVPPLIFKFMIRDLSNCDRCSSLSFCDVSQITDCSCQDGYVKDTQGCLKCGDRFPNSLTCNSEQPLSCDEGWEVLDKECKFCAIAINSTCYTCGRNYYVYENECTPTSIDYGIKEAWQIADLFDQVPFDGGRCAEWELTASVTHPERLFQNVETDC